jgi:hypothetical protein
MLAKENRMKLSAFAIALVLALGSSCAHAERGNAGALRSNGTTMPGPATATTTHEQDSDAKIDAENLKLDRIMKICRGC